MLLSGRWIRTEMIDTSLMYLPEALRMPGEIWLAGWPWGFQTLLCFYFRSRQITSWKKTKTELMNSCESYSGFRYLHVIHAASVCSNMQHHVTKSLSWRSKVRSRYDTLTILDLSAAASKLCPDVLPCFTKVKGCHILCLLLVDWHLLLKHFFVKWRHYLLFRWFSCRWFITFLLSPAWTKSPGLSRFIKSLHQQGPWIE